ncbi:MAG: hypothetical protein ACI8SE_001771, partial [Bacteroidia bacterium]
MKINNTRLFFLSLAFIAFTVIGTLSHECGHIAVAKVLGYHTTLHYASMNSYSSETMKRIDDRLNASKLTESINDDALLKASFKPKNHRLWITLGGPAQTMLTGLLGFFLLSKRRKTKRQKAYGLVDWLLVFLSLFWLREVFNLTMTLAYGYLGNKTNYFAGNGDEIKISDALGLPSHIVPV